MLDPSGRPRPPAPRGSNALAVARALRSSGASTVSELARRSGLSRPSVEEILRSLVGADWVVELDAAPGGRGRPARRYQFRPDLGYVLGVDIGAHKVLAVATDLDGRVLARTRVGLDPQAGRSERLARLDEVAEACVAEAGLDTSDVWAIGVASTGVIRSDGQVALSVAVPEWTNVDLAGHFAVRFDCPIVVDNDCRLAALAEAWYGVASQARDVVYVLAGLRTGAGLIIDGRLHRGHGGTAGEIGALPFAGWESAQSCLHRYTALPPGVGLDEAPTYVFEAARKGEPQACSVVDRYARHLAFGTAALVLTLDPELVVLGGGFARAGAVLLDPFRQELAAMSIRPPHVELSTLGEECVAFGAVRLALDTIDQQTFGVRRTGLGVRASDPAGRAEPGWG
jgi:predicted NBD/HSP70 family sugar kinase